MAEIGRRGLLGLLGGAAIAPFIPVGLRTPTFQPAFFVGSSGISHGWTDWRGEFSTILESLAGSQDFQVWEPSVWKAWRAENSVEDWYNDE